MDYLGFSPNQFGSDYNTLVVSELESQIKGVVQLILDEAHSQRSSAENPWLISAGFIGGGAFAFALAVPGLATATLAGAIFATFALASSVASVAYGLMSLGFTAAGEGQLVRREAPAAKQVFELCSNPESTLLGAAVPIWTGDPRDLELGVVIGSLVDGLHDTSESLKLLKEGDAWQVKMAKALYGIEQDSRKLVKIVAERRHREKAADNRSRVQNETPADRTTNTTRRNNAEQKQPAARKADHDEQADFQWIDLSTRRDRFNSDSNPPAQGQPPPPQQNPPAQQQPPPPQQNPPASLPPTAPQSAPPVPDTRSRSADSLDNFSAAYTANQSSGYSGAPLGSGSPNPTPEAPTCEEPSNSNESTPDTGPQMQKPP